MICINLYCNGSMHCVRAKTTNPHRCLTLHTRNHTALSLPKHLQFHNNWHYGCKTSSTLKLQMDLKHLENFPPFIKQLHPKFALFTCFSSAFTWFVSMHVLFSRNMLVKVIVLQNTECQTKFKNLEHIVNHITTKELPSVINLLLPSLKKTSLDKLEMNKKTCNNL